MPEPRGRPYLPWVKVWDVSLSDPKLAGWSLADFGLWVELLLLAGQSPVRGKLMLTATRPMTDDEIREALRLKNSDRGVFARQIPRMVELDMVHRDDAGALCITHWRQRQDKYPSDFPPNKLRISSARGDVREDDISEETAPDLEAVYGGLVAEYGEAAIAEAVAIARRRGKATAAYVKGILRNGIAVPVIDQPRTVDDLRREEAERDAKRKAALA